MRRVVLLAPAALWLAACTDTPAPPAGSGSGARSGPPPGLSMTPKDSKAALAQCAAKAYDGYASDMIGWEDYWAQAVQSVRPELADAAKARAHANALGFKRDGVRIHYLVDSSPDALEYDESVAALRAGDWTDDQEAALRKAHSSYASLSDEADQAQKTSDANPKARDLEHYFEESFGDADGADTTRKLQAILSRGNDTLETCRQDYPQPEAAPLELQHTEHDLHTLPTTEFPLGTGAQPAPPKP